MKTVCIMGGGLGGLMTGALLAKEGYRVTVLEKNRIIGGGLQSFRRGPYTFDTGMHVFGGMGTDGQVRRICRHLGIENRLEIEPCYDTLMDAKNGLRVTLPFGRKAWTYKWSRCLKPVMPNVNISQEISDYLDKLYDIARQEPLYSLLPTTDDYTLPDTSLTAKHLMAAGGCHQSRWRRGTLRRRGDSHKDRRAERGSSVHDGRLLYSRPLHKRHADSTPAGTDANRRLLAGIPPPHRVGAILNVGNDPVHRPQASHPVL